MTKCSNGTIIIVGDNDASTAISTIYNNGILYKRRFTKEIFARTPSPLTEVTLLLVVKGKSIFFEEFSPSHTQYSRWILNQILCIIISCEYF